jgi:hypothetical protein
LKQDDLIIHYHCLITISESNNDSFLTVSGDSEIISYVHIRLNTNILAEWRQTDQLSTLFNIRHPGKY